MGSIPAKPLPNAGSLVAMLTLLMATCWVAHRIAHAIDAEYGVAVGLVACADYGASLARLLRRLVEYNRQSEALYVRSHSLAARGPAIPGIVATIDDLIEH